MTTYQDLFNNMETIDPSILSQQQDALASLFPGIPSLNSTMIDDWLVDELCKSGLIANSLDFFSGSNKLAMLPHSPPISPSSSAMSDNSSQKSTSSGSPKTPCYVSLFPDIAAPPIVTVAHKKQQQQQQSAPVVTIMPKTTLPRIAPRPTTAVTPTIKKPSTSITGNNSNKRCMMDSNNVVDQDETALKRQKNTDAARRSRMKKLIKMEHLEQRVSELESDNHRLTTRIAVLESEKSGLESKDVSLEDRIRVLEAQLAEAHKALTKV